MPPVGKSGTVTPDEFDLLSGYAETYGAMLLAKKVSKICNKFSEPFKHEYANSAIAAAWINVATSISRVIGGNVRGSVSMEAFEFLGSLVNTYGPEVVIQKLSKIASKSGDTATANSLKNLFPKAVSTTAARRAA